MTGNNVHMLASEWKHHKREKSEKSLERKNAIGSDTAELHWPIRRLIRSPVQQTLYEETTTMKENTYYNIPLVEAVGDRVGNVSTF